MRCARCCRWHRGGLGFRSSLFTPKSIAHRCQTALELEICPKNLRDLSIVKSAGRQTGRFQQPWACREGPRYSTLLLRTLMGELRHASGRGTRWRSVFSNLFLYEKNTPRGVLRRSLSNNQRRLTQMASLFEKIKRSERE